MQTEVILPLVAYLLLVFGLSVYAYRRRQNGNFLSEYFLGNRSMGGFVLAMTLTATYISASSFIGGPGAAYKYGLGWVLLAMIQLPAVWLSLGVLGKKFAILARRYNAITLNDMLYGRYQSRLLVWLASLSLLVAFLGAMTVQFIGGARLLETAAGIPYDTGLLIFGISIALYTAFGGFRASVLNDACCRLRSLTRHPGMAGLPAKTSDQAPLRPHDATRDNAKAPLAGRKSGVFQHPLDFSFCDQTLKLQ